MLLPHIALPRVPILCFFAAICLHTLCSLALVRHILWVLLGLWCAELRNVMQYVSTLADGIDIDALFQTSCGRLSDSAYERFGTRKSQVVLSSQGYRVLAHFLRENRLAPLIELVRSKFSLNRIRYRFLSFSRISPSCSLYHSSSTFPSHILFIVFRPHSPLTFSSSSFVHIPLSHSLHRLSSTLPSHILFIVFRPHSPLTFSSSSFFLVHTITGTSHTHLSHTSASVCAAPHNAHQRSRLHSPFARITRPFAQSPPPRAARKHVCRRDSPCCPPQASLPSRVMLDCLTLLLHVLLVVLWMALRMALRMLL